MGSPGDGLLAKKPRFAGISTRSTRLSTGVDSLTRRGDRVPRKPSFCSRFPPENCPQLACGEVLRESFVYTGDPRRLPVLLPRFSFVRTLDEADLPAQRSSPQAQARLPRADVDSRRPGDPEAPPREGP